MIEVIKVIMQLMNVILVWLFFGFLCSYLAKKKGKPTLLWFFIGLFLGILGVLLFVILSFLENRKILTPHASPPPKHPVPATSLSPPLNQIWYYLDKSRQPQGPLALSELNTLWQGQQLNEQSYLWTEGMVEWKKLHDLTEVSNEIKK